MAVMLTSVFILLIITAFQAGIGIRLILATVSTVLFSARKVKLFVNRKTIITIECVGLALSAITAAMFKYFSWKEYLIYIAIRLVFILIVIYEENTYIFIDEEIIEDDTKK